MDIIQRAIEKKQHVSKRIEINRQNWSDFKENANDKKIFMFGIGACADFVFENYKDITLEGIIDNDIKKQGFRLDDFIEEVRTMECGSLKVSSIEILKRYSVNELVILITSINFYEQIIEQLEAAGVENYFVALIMEANRRRKQNYYEKIDDKQLRGEYIKSCCKKEIKDDKLFFYSFGTYSDHGKYITEALLRVRRDLDIVWVVNDLRTEVPEGVRKIYSGNWKRYIYEMETAKIWIYNMVVPRYIIKRPGQIYIQTKHWASVTLKRFYLDAATIQDVSENVDNWKYNSKIMDYIITGSAFDTESCRRGFGFSKEAVQIGSPRSDALFRQNECREKVYSFYEMNISDRTLIYAPTYRFNRSNTAHMHESRSVNLDFETTKRALEQRFGGNWYIMLRLHPSVAKESAKMEKPDYVIDASNYEDSEELVAACDIMISDYSSILFEPAFVKKPVFLFAADKKDYIDKEYDLLIDYNTLPFPIAETNEELAENIKCFEQAEYEKKVDAFMEQYGVHEDGHASERAARFISELIDKGE